MLLYGFFVMVEKKIISADVVHSDLKPANFLLVNGGLKLIDFGIAASIQVCKRGRNMSKYISSKLFMILIFSRI